MAAFSPAGRVRRDSALGPLATPRLCPAISEFALIVRLNIILTVSYIGKEAAMTTTLTVTANGQVTLRKDILRHLGITPSQKVEIDLLPNGRLQLRAATAATSIEDFFGCLYRPRTTPLTIEDIGEIAAGGWAGRR
jgi:hypothetical protein